MSECSKASVRRAEGTETHLLKTAVDRSNVRVHLPKDVLPAQLCQEVAPREHLACCAVRVVVEAEDVYDAACAVRPGVLS
jgi:hypothetical protein